VGDLAQRTTRVPFLNKSFNRPGIPPPCFSPVHQIAIPNLDLLLGDTFDLEAIALDTQRTTVTNFCSSGRPYRLQVPSAPR
jgi:hypothetical protein